MNSTTPQSVRYYCVHIYIYIGRCVYIAYFYISISKVKLMEKRPGRSISSNKSSRNSMKCSLRMHSLPHNPCRIPAILRDLEMVIHKLRSNCVSLTCPVVLQIYCDAKACSLADRFETETRMVDTNT